MAPYDLAPETYPDRVAHPVFRLLAEIRDWLNHLESVFAWHVDRFQR